MHKISNKIEPNKLLVLSKTKTLVNDLRAGENSGMISNFDRERALSYLHTKYLRDEI
jgi:hypothetical protein